MTIRSTSGNGASWLGRLTAVVRLGAVVVAGAVAGCNSSTSAADAGEPPIDEGAAISGNCPAVPCFRTALVSCPLALPCFYRQNGDVLDVCYSNGTRASVRTKAAASGTGVVTTVTRRGPDGKACMVTEWDGATGAVSYANGAGQPIASGVADRSDAAARAGRINLTCNSMMYDVDPSGCAGAWIEHCAEGSCP